MRFFKSVFLGFAATVMGMIEWYKGSGLRPYLENLDTTEKTEFLNELLEIIKQNFPIQADKSVILKMPRLFFTANKR